MIEEATSTSAIINDDEITSVHKTTMAVTFIEQIKLLEWKNLLIARRKPFSLLLEIALPLIFVSVLVVIRIFVEKVHFEKQFYEPTSVLNMNNHYHWSSKSRALVLYYPNVSIVEDLVVEASSRLAMHNPGFSPIGRKIEKLRRKIRRNTFSVFKTYIKV